MALVYQDEWERLSDSIKSLEKALGLIIAAPTSHTGVKDPTVKLLLEEANTLVENIKNFDQNFGQLLPPPAQDRLEKFFNDYNNNDELPMAEEIWKKIPTFVKLFSFRREFSRYFNDNQVRIRKTVEIAFAHLQRQLMVDKMVQESWASKKNETDFEKLGSNHLLWHRIWAFKVNTEGERTDLVLSEPINSNRFLDSSVDGLVLTEWKVVRSSDKVQNKINEAKCQAALYTKGSLYALELKTHRYLILVSEKNITIPEDKEEFTDGGITYRVINLAYKPEAPSIQARKNKPRKK